MISGVIRWGEGGKRGGGGSGGGSDEIVIGQGQLIRHISIGRVSE